MTAVAYLDNNATTILHPEVAQAMMECMAGGYANPASQHSEGRRARKVLEEARLGIGRILGARMDSVDADRVIFTSGGTEANNLAIRGRWDLDALRSGSKANSKRTQFVVSTIEHPSVLEAARSLATRGASIQWVPVNEQGVVQLSALESLLSDETACVAIMSANNETGVMQPMNEVVRICQGASKDGISVHTDAVQVAGKLPLSFHDLGVATMTVTAHKLHGPRGIGALLIRHNDPLQPILFGGSQQLATRPGTESVVLAVGMHVALQLWERESAERVATMTHLRDQFERDLCQALPDVVIHGNASPRLPHTSNVSFPGLDRQALLLALDRAGVACSTGSACTSGSSEPSHVLLAMGCSQDLVSSSLRISLSSLTTTQEVEFAVEKMVEISGKIRSF